MAAINFFGSLSAPQTASVILKMISGITLIDEMLFWEAKKHPGRVITSAVISRVVIQLRKSRGQQRMSDLLTTQVYSGNCYSKSACMEELQHAVNDSRRVVRKGVLRKKTIAGDK